jgi:hypothetical protein
MTTHLFHLLLTVDVDITHLLLAEYKIYVINCPATVVKLEMPGDSEGLLHS